MYANSSDSPTVGTNGVGLGVKHELGTFPKKTWKCGKFSQVGDPPSPQFGNVMFVRKKIMVYSAFFGGGRPLGVWSVGCFEKAKEGVCSTGYVVTHGSIKNSY